MIVEKDVLVERCEQLEMQGQGYQLLNKDLQGKLKLSWENSIAKKGIIE